MKNLHPDPAHREWYYDGDGQKRHKITGRLWIDESDDRAKTPTQEGNQDAEHIKREDSNEGSNSESEA